MVVLEILIKISILKKIIKLFELNQYNKKNISTIIENLKPDEIYNLSGLSSVAKSFKKRKETFKSIVETNSYILETLTKNKNIKYYNACSSECFGDTGNDSANEKTKFKPCSPYAIAKSTAYWTSNMYREVHNIFACLEFYLIMSLTLDQIILLLRKSFHLHIGFQGALMKNLN